MRISTLLVGGFLALTFAASGTAAVAGSPSGSGIAGRQPVTDLSSQERARRPITRLRVYPRYQPPSDGVYPRYYPGANAVRECTANYAPEYRPSGTVITPRVSCLWRPG